MHSQLVIMVEQGWRGGASPTMVVYHQQLMDHLVVVLLLMMILLITLYDMGTGAADRVL